MNPTAKTRKNSDGGAPVGQASRPERRLPRDATTLPLDRGELLVSRSHAVFCRIPPEYGAGIHGVLEGARPLDSLPGDLLEDLDDHGFFGEPRPPEEVIPTVQLQITNECNLDCTYCCTNSGCARSREVTYEQARTVVHHGREVLGPGGRMSLLGGEPLTVPWCLDLAQEMVELDLDTCLFTNGLPLRESGRARQVAELSQAGMEVRVSLAGPDAPLCDSISGTERFEPALQGLHELARHGGQAVVNLMLMPQNYEAVAARLHELKENLPPKFSVALGVLYVSGREAGEHVFASPEELEGALDTIAFEAGERIPVAPPSPLTHRREGCGCALGHHLHMRSDGALFPCFKMEEKLGTLHDTAFKEAMLKNRANPHRAPDLQVCKDCPLATLCGGGCRSENILYTGDGDVPYCAPWRVRVLSELLAEDAVKALEWPLAQLAAEARRRGIDAPERLEVTRPSRHLWDAE